MGTEEYNTLKELLVDYDRTTGLVAKEQAQTATEVAELRKEVRELKYQTLTGDIVIIIVLLFFFLKLKKKNN